MDRLAAQALLGCASSASSTGRSYSAKRDLVAEEPLDQGQRHQHDVEREEEFEAGLDLCPDTHNSEHVHHDLVGVPIRIEQVGEARALLKAAAAMTLAEL